MRDFRLALAFLTRLPVPVGPPDARGMAPALVWFPAVGLVIGALAWTVAAVAPDGLSVAFVSVAIVTAWAAVTGGLHLDGLADLVDALGGGRGDRERMLAIMKDARVGAHGAVALVLGLVAKLVLVGDALAADAVWAVVLAPVAARWAVVALIGYFPYARAEGLGTAFPPHASRAALPAASLVGGAILLALGGAGAIVPLAVAFALVLLIGRWITARLGGLTGDVYGAAVEAAEIAFVAAALA